MLYLIRHTDASASEIDSERPLSAEGRLQAERVGAFLRTGREFKPAEIWHSPLVRARETAVIIAGCAARSAILKQVPDLEPSSDPLAMAERLRGLERSVAIVGHNPHLCVLATLLATGAAAVPLFDMRKGAVIAFEPARGSEPGGWVACWHIIPDLLG